MKIFCIFPQALIINDCVRYCCYSWWFSISLPLSPLSLSFSFSMFIFCNTHTNWCAVELNSTICTHLCGGGCDDEGRLSGGVDGVRHENKKVWARSSLGQRFCVRRVAAIKVRWTKAFYVCPWSSGTSTRYETVPSLILALQRRAGKKSLALMIEHWHDIFFSFRFCSN